MRNEICGPNVKEVVVILNVWILDVDLKWVFSKGINAYCNGVNQCGKFYIHVMQNTLIKV